MSDLTYTDIIGLLYPTLQVISNNGNPNDYSSLVVIAGGPIPSQSQLDNDIASYVYPNSQHSGFATRETSTFSFDDNTRTFTIQPTTNSFDFYSVGYKFTKYGPDSITIPNVEGQWYFYYNETGILQAQQNPPIFNTDFSKYAVIAIIYWSVSQNKALYLGEERHSIIQDWKTHQYLHLTQGTRYESGFDLTNFVINGSTSDDTSAQISINDGKIADEDIEISIVNSPTPTPPWQQVLSPIAKIPIVYRIGPAATVNWLRDTATNFPVKQGTNTIQYNQLNSGVWSAVDAPDNSYIAVWVIATNDIREPVVAILGSSADTTLFSARDNNQWLTLDFTRLDFFIEFRPLYRLIFQTSSSFTNTPKAVLVDIIDVSGISVLQVSTGAGTSHLTLGGLLSDDHPQYVHEAIPRTIQAQHMFNPISPSAPFVLGPNAQTQLVTGLNVDLLDGKHSTDLILKSGDTMLGFLTLNSDPTNNLHAATKQYVDNAPNQTITLTGDITGSGTGSFATTLATINTNIGSWGDTTHVGSFTVNGKGLITAASSSAIAFPVISVAGKTGIITLVNSDVGLGNVTNDAQVALSSVTTKGDLLVATANATISRLGIGSDGQILTADSTQTSGIKWATATTPAPINSAYVTIGNDATLTSERALTGTANQISITDNGTNNTVVLSIATNPILPGTASVTIPLGTTAQRPGSPFDGMLRYNTDNDVVESYIAPYGLTTSTLWAGLQRSMSNKKYLYLKDEFMSGSTASTGVSLYGQLNWSITAAGTAANSNPLIAIDHPGILQIGTGATSGNNTRLHLGSTNTTLITAASQVGYFAWLIRIPTITSITLKLGMGTDISSSTFGTDGVFFSFVPGTSANWQFISRTGSVSTTVTTTQVVSANTWYFLEAYNVLGNWTPVVNGTVNSAASSAGLAAVNIGVLVQTGTAASRTIQLDMFTMISSELGNRY